jgi:hypothetical protein
MRVERTWFESIEEHEAEDILSNYSMVKGKCVLVLCPNNYLITHCIASINFDGSY